MNITRRRPKYCHDILMSFWCQEESPQPQINLDMCPTCLGTMICVFEIDTGEASDQDYDWIITDLDIWGMSCSACQHHANCLSFKRNHPKIKFDTCPKWPLQNGLCVWDWHWWGLRTYLRLNYSCFLGYTNVMCLAKIMPIVSVSRGITPNKVGYMSNVQYDIMIHSFTHLRLMMRPPTTLMSKLSRVKSNTL